MNEDIKKTEAGAERSDIDAEKADIDTEKAKVDVEESDADIDIEKSDADTEKTGTERGGKKISVTRNCVLGVFFFLLAILSGSYLLLYQIKLNKYQKMYESLQNQSEDDSGIIIVEPEAIKPQEEAEEPPVALPSDENMVREIPFQTLQSETNPDIYAWVYLPETNIDYPVLQHPTSDSYYLDYNLDGTKGYPGCIYTEGLNRKDFSDFNTLIYGHNMRNGSMFHDLHLYREETFFKEHPFVYIYLPERTLKYQIFAAYAYDDRHILYSFDFNDKQVRQEYLEEIMGEPGPKGLVNRDVEVGEASHVVTLSTCIGGKSSNRFLVQAVLVDEWNREGLE